MRFVAICLALVGTACFDPVFHSPACGPAGECPPGFRCEAGTCRAPDPAPDGPQARDCNVIAQTGCGAAEKCTVSLGGGAASVITCGSAGTVPVGEACTRAGPADDDCAPGAWCAGGFCEAFCDRNAPSCGNIAFCAAHYGELLPHAPLGSCAFECDPVSQLRFDGQAACGSRDLGNPSHGCYGHPDDRFFCAPVGAPGRHGDPVGLGSGEVYANACEAGFHPGITYPGETVPRCMATCQPAETYDSNPGGAGGVPGSGYQCNDRGAFNAECRYIFLFQSSPGTPYYPDYGYCLDYYLLGLPSCTNISPVDANGDGFLDHVQQGCGPI